MVKGQSWKRNMRGTQGNHEDGEKSMWEEKHTCVNDKMEMKDMRHDVMMTSWARPQVMCTGHVTFESQRENVKFDSEEKLKKHSI